MEGGMERVREGKGREGKRKVKGGKGRKESVNGNCGEFASMA